MTSRWSTQFTQFAEEDLAALTRTIRRRILEKLEWLEANFDSITPLTLTHEWSGFYKLRVGDYRVVYRIDWEHQIIIIEAIDHRSKIYKRRK